MSQDIPDTERLLSAYRFWGLASVLFFAMSLMSMFVVLSVSGLNLIMLALPLCFGFLWIGTTSLSRHCLVELKKCVGKEVGLPEFVRTQFVFALFPFIYRELKKDVAVYESAAERKEYC